jgi:hypothetical protein
MSLQISTNLEVDNDLAHFADDRRGWRNFD